MLQILDLRTPGLCSWALSCQYVQFSSLEFMNFQDFADKLLSANTMFCQWIVKLSLLIRYAELGRVLSW